MIPRLSLNGIRPFWRLLPALTLAPALFAQPVEPLGSIVGFGLGLGHLNEVGTCYEFGLLLHVARDQPIQGRIRLDSGTANYAQIFGYTSDSQPVRAHTKVSFTAISYEILWNTGPTPARGWLWTLGIGVHHHQESTPNLDSGSIATWRPDYVEGSYLGGTLSGGIGYRFNAHLSCEGRVAAAFLSDFFDRHSFNRTRVTVGVVVRP
ncbi:MAG: hypothetical protein IPN59_09870 [Holophaga sp.]|nr:hypothetical protein [Holophaga sp.]